MIKTNLIFLVQVFPVPKMPVISFTHKDGGFLPVSLVSCLELAVFQRMLSVKSSHPKLSLQNTSLAPPWINVNNMDNDNDVSFRAPQVRMGISRDLVKLPSRRQVSTKRVTRLRWERSDNSTGFKQDPLFCLLLHFNSPHLKREELSLGQVIHARLC